MATWTPVEGLVPQETQDGGQAAGMVLKFYEPGTTTPLTMATDNTGGTTTTNFLLDSQGRTTNGGTICVPHTSTAYKAILYLNQADADADTTGSAVYSVNDIDTFEPALGNPSVNGQVLSSTTAGVRSWADPTTSSLGNPDTDGQVLSSTSAGVRSWVDNGALPNWGFPSAVGASFSTAGLSTVGNISALSKSTFAGIDSSTENLQAYSYSGTTITTLGSALNIAGINVCGLAAYSSTDVAIASGTTGTIQSYRFNGSTWSALGSPSAVFSGIPQMEAMNATDIAILTNSGLQLYRLSGTTWAAQGNLLSITGTQTSGLAALNNTDVAMFNQDDDSLYIYRTDGTDWTQVGDALDLSSTANFGTVMALNSTDFIFCSTGATDYMQVFRFNGVSITAISGKYTADAFGASATYLTSLGGPDFIVWSSAVFQAYRYGFSIGAPYSQSLLV